MTKRHINILLSFVLLVSCAAHRHYQRAVSIEQDSRLQDAHRLYLEGAHTYPEDSRFLEGVRRTSGSLAEEYIEKALVDEAKGRGKDAETAYRQAMRWDPRNAKARAGLERLLISKEVNRLSAEARGLASQERYREAYSRNHRVLVLDPNNSGAQELERLLIDLMEAESFQASSEGQLSVNLEGARLRDVLFSISEVSGLNLVIDETIGNPLVSLQLRDRPFETLLENLLTAHGLFSVPLDPVTYYILPDTRDNRRRFEVLGMRVFYLYNAEAAPVADLLRVMVKESSVVVNPDLNAILVRGSEDQLAVAEGIIAANDIRSMEVIIDLEMLEINRTRLQQLGLELDSYKIGGEIRGPVLKEGRGGISLGDLQDIGQGNLFFTIPSFYYDFLKSDDGTRTLANPTIRILNRKKAKLHIGEKVPIRTYTSLFRDTQEETTSFEYKDIGIKLEITPKIQLNSEVVLDLSLEVSSIVQENIQNQPVIGTRYFETSLRLRDGELEILGGLIRDEERTQRARVPLLGDIPLIGHFFSGDTTRHQETDIVMTLTPRLLFHPGPFEDASRTIWTGTSSDLDGDLIRRGYTGENRSVNSGQPGQYEGSPIGGISVIDSDSPPDPDSSPDSGTGESSPSATPLPELPATSARVFIQTEEGMRGRPISIPIRIRSASNVGSVPFYLYFDPSIVRITEAREGDFLNQDGATTAFLSSVDNKKGLIIIGLSRLGTETGVSGSGTLVWIEFEGTASGSSPLRFDRASVRDPQMRTLPAKFVNGSVLIR